MAHTITLNGVSRQPRLTSMRVSQTSNGHSTASLTLLIEGAAYRPEINDELIIQENAFRQFGGLVERPRERSFILGTDFLEIDVSATDFNGYPARRIVQDALLPAGTLKTALTYFVDNFLAVFGVTLDPSQDEGPMLPALEYKNESLLNVLNQLMTLTAEHGIAYAWRINYFKVLRASQPGTNVAPFDCSDANEDKILGDVEVEESRTNNYANRVIVELAPQADAGHVETFPGDDVTDTFTLQWKLIQAYGIIHVYELDGVTPAGGETFAIVGTDTATQWLYYPETGQMTRVIGPTDATKIYSLTFSGTYEAKAVAETAEAATDPWEIVVTVEKVPEDTTLQALAESHLAKSSIIIKTASYKTLEEGIEVGQEQLVNIANRAVNAVGMITDVVFTDYVQEGVVKILKTVKVTIDPSLTNLDRGWRDVYRIWAGDKMGAGVGAATLGVSPAPVAGGPAPPLTSVQTNQNNLFHGDAEFTYNPETNSVVCGGGGSSITAAVHESCQVFGYNCHIADP